MEKPTKSMMIAKNMAAECEAVKDYLPLLDNLEPGSKEAEQIIEIIGDELSHTLVLTAMLIKERGLLINEDAMEAIRYLAKKA